jgi:hypothetical protein
VNIITSTCKIMCALHLVLKRGPECSVVLTNGRFLYTNGLSDIFGNIIIFGGKMKVTVTVVFSYRGHSIGKFLVRTV